MPRLQLLSENIGQKFIYDLCRPLLHIAGGVGVVGERGRFATTSLYLVILSNREISGSSPTAGGKGGANSADACPGCGDAATAPKAVRSSFKRVNLLRLRRGGVRTHGLCFALPKNLGPGVTGAHFPFYACRRRSIDAVIFAPKKQQIPHQRDGGGITTLGARRVLPNPCAAAGQEGVFCRFTRSAPLLPE